MNSPQVSVDVARTVPPPAPLAFRVGVVGHRPNRLGHADGDQLASVLGTILGTVMEEVQAMHLHNQALFDGSAPVVRAISPLAEGTDRIFAEQALQLGFELCCVMPFAQTEFEQDFGPGKALEDNSLTRFQDLAGRARTRFELDGCRADEEGAYSAAGRVVLNQSDLLVVVWDGDRQEKRGGTEETLDDARRHGVSVVWVDAHAPHRWQILDPTTPLPHASRGMRVSPRAGEAIAALRESVRAALDLPKPPPPAPPHESKLDVGENPAHGLKSFYAERQPSWTVAVVWKAFRDIVGDSRRPRASFSIRPFEADAMGEWPDDRTTPVGQIVSQIRPYFAWPDKLAVVYSDRYRSAFVLAFLLAAVAVGMALMPFGFRMEDHHLPATLCIILELSAILIILSLVMVGRHRRWHERWINYRLTAELVRHLRLVAPLGGGRPFPQIPAHWATYGPPGSTWMAWYVRGVERRLGLPGVIVNNNYLDACLGQVSHLVDDQISFHEISANRCHRIEKRLHRIEIMLLVLTLASCGLHFLPSVWPGKHLPDWLPPLLTFFCGFFPALGAALAGILNQGEFRRIAMRSESMRRQLLLVGKEIESLRQRIKASPVPCAEQFSVRANGLASDVARLLVNEVLDWRVVFLDRPFEQPPA